MTRRRVGTPDASPPPFPADTRAAARIRPGPSTVASSNPVPSSLAPSTPDSSTPGSSGFAPSTSASSTPGSSAPGSSSRRSSTPVPSNSFPSTPPSVQPGSVQPGSVQPGSVQRHGGVAVRHTLVRCAVLVLASVGVGTALAAGATVVTHARPALAAGPAVTALTPAPAPGPAPSAAPAPGPSAPPASPAPGPSAPAATPSPAPPPSPPADSTGDSPGLFDIPGQIRKAINDFLLWIAQSALTPVLDTLGHTVLSTPDVTGNNQIKALWTASLITANAIFVLFVMAGGFVVASRETLQSRYGLKEIAPRIAVAGVAANVSLLVCAKMIEAVNALTGAIAGQGVDGASAATAIRQMLDQSITPGQTPPVLFSLLILAALVMAVVVVITFLLRTATLSLLIGIAPLALTCHATPQTEGLAYTWWRAVGACLGIQLGQAVIVLGTVKVFLTPAGMELFGLPATTGGLVGLLICVSMLWLLIKLPGWMRHFILGPLGQRGGRGLVGQIIHAVIMLKTLGALVGAGRGAAVRAGRPPRPGPGGAPAPGRSPRPGGPRPSRPTAPRRTPRPSPAGPAMFSHAPATHTSLAQPAGGTASPAFSSAPQPATPRPSPVGGVPPARFSHPVGAQPTPPASSRPGPAVFSNPSSPSTRAVSSSRSGSSTASRRPAGPVPAAMFSSAPQRQAAPKRPPAPVTPVFAAPSTANSSGRSRPAPSTSRASRPAPPSTPSTPTSASVAPSARRRPRGGDR